MSEQAKIDKLTHKSSSEFYDPCALENKRSMKCIEENYLNRSKCNQFFKEYRECKKLWGDIRNKERLKNGGLFSNASKMPKSAEPPIPPKKE